MAYPYDYKWQQARAVFLKEHSLCVMCLEQGKFTKSTIVDHIQPHRMNMELFWDKGNWQALCKHCHDKHKKRIENTGNEIGCNTNGLPLKPNAYWR